MPSGRKALLFLGALVVTCTAAVVLLLVLGPGGKKESSPEPALSGEETREPHDRGEGEAEADQERPWETIEGEAAEEETLSVTPGGGGNGQSVVIRLPDPPTWEEGVPEAVGQGIAGHWVLEMEGSPFALSNCHLLLGEDGSITLPPDYRAVFESNSGKYTWDAEARSFQAEAGLVVKAGPGGTPVPLRLDMEGKVSESLQEITGSYQVVPEGKAYAHCSQQGGFLMSR